MGELMFLATATRWMGRKQIATGRILQHPRFFCLYGGLCCLHQFKMYYVVIHVIHNYTLQEDSGHIAILKYHTNIFILTMG